MKTHDDHSSWARNVYKQHKFPRSDAKVNRSVRGNPSRDESAHLLHDWNIISRYWHSTRTDGLRNRVSDLALGGRDVHGVISLDSS